MHWDDFLKWEQGTLDVLDFKKIYVDMAGGDINAGLVLSEIVYWHLPNQNGQSKLRVRKHGKYWIAVRRNDWWDRVRISPKQADRAIGLLIKRGLIEKCRAKFKGEPTVHVRIVPAGFLEHLEFNLDCPASNPFCTESEEPIDSDGHCELVEEVNTIWPKPGVPYTEINVIGYSKNKNKKHWTD